VSRAASIRAPVSERMSEFLDAFAVPLLGGGTVHVGRPLRPRDRDLLVSELPSAVHHPALSLARLRRAEELTPVPDLPHADEEELSLVVALHNVLVFDHPDRGRVWARASSWRRAEGATRTLLTLPFPTEIGPGLVRHLWVGAFLGLMRTDRVVPGPAGEVRYLGQSVPRRRFRFGPPAADGGRTEDVRWLEQPHAPETQRLVEDALRASPLTCLLHPTLAPPGWSPLWASLFLRRRGYARAICHRWARQRDWIAVGGAVMAALLPSLPAAAEDEESSRPFDASQTQDDPGPRALPGAVVPADPGALSAVVGALVHLHFLKVLELDARLGLALGSRDPGIMSFLALPLLLPYVGEVTGTPLGALVVPGRSSGNPGEGVEAQAHRLWTEYLDHLQELVPRSALENLLATLVPAIVRTS
jgi:hypothetical protein